MLQWPWPVWPPALLILPPLHWAASNNRNKIRALFMLKQEDANNVMLVQEERDNIRKTFVTVRTLRGQQCIGMHVRAKEF